MPGLLRSATTEAETYRLPRTPGPAQAAGWHRSGDMVRFTHPRHGVLSGYGALDKKKSRVALAHNVRPVSARTS